MGDGAITSLSRKQGMITGSSTKAEVVPADEIISPMIWTQLFLMHRDILPRKISSFKTTKVPCCLRRTEARVLASALVT